MTDLTREEIAELRKFDQAVPADWEVQRHDYEDGSIGWEVWSRNPFMFLFRLYDDMDEKGAEARVLAGFIALCRTLVPRLLDMVERQQAEIWIEGPRGFARMGLGDER